MADLDIYPLTICKDRYTGVYSGGKYTAWRCYPWEVPFDVFADDVSCQIIWQQLKAASTVQFGVGDTPDEAVANMIKHKPD